MKHRVIVVGGNGEEGLPNAVKQMLEQVLSGSEISEEKPEKCDGLGGCGACAGHAVSGPEEFDTFHDNQSLDAFLSDLPVSFDTINRTLNYIRNYAEDYADRVVEHNSAPQTISQDKANEILAEMGYVVG